MVAEEENAEHINASLISVNHTDVEEVVENKLNILNFYI